MLKMPEMPPASVPQAEKAEALDLQNKRGKELETVIFGESKVSIVEGADISNDDIARLNRATARQLKMAVDYSTNSPEMKESLSKFVDGWVENPAPLKLTMSSREDERNNLAKRLAEVSGNEKRGVKYSNVENSSAVRAKLSKTDNILRGLNNFKDTIKKMQVDAEKRGEPGMLGKICDVMSKIQEAEPIKKAFSNSLIFSLRRILSEKGVEINNLQFVTTLVSGGDKVMTWPDFFGVDSFLNYDFVIDGVQKKGRILFDGTANVKKSGGKIGGDGAPYESFGGGKFIIPFDKLKTEEDIPSLAIEVARHIATQTLPNLT